MEGSCRARTSTGDGGDPGSRRAFFQADGDGPDDDLGTAGFLTDGSETGGATITAANSTASSGAGRTSLPCRAIVLQVDKWFGFKP